MKKEPKTDNMVPKTEQKDLGIVRTVNQVISRYPQLTVKLKRNLTDFYNGFVGLTSIAYGNEDQREFALQIVRDRISRGDKPFPEDPLTSRVREELEKGQSGFAQIDLEHITEITSLVQGINVAATAGKLTQPLAQRAYEILIPYLYGRNARSAK